MASEPPSSIPKSSRTPQRSSSLSVGFLRQYPLVRGSIRHLLDTDYLTLCKVYDQDCCLSQDDEVMFRIPLPVLLDIAPWNILVQLAKGHSLGLRHDRRKTVDIQSAFATHTCVATCHRLCVVLQGANRNLFRVVQPHGSVGEATQTVFRSQGTEPTQMTLIFDENSQEDGVCTPASSVASNRNEDVTMVEPVNNPPPSFPPKVLPISERIDIMREWSEYTHTKIEEDICACCAQRVRRYTITRVPLTSKLLLPLADRHRPPGTAAKDHLILCSAAIENGEAKLCDLCRRNLERKNMPQIALANGLSLGEVPPELKKLSFVEKLIVAKYRHYISVIRVAKSGQRKLAGNAIVFAQPVPKFYDILPPPREDLDDCLSVLFTGTSRPTYEDFKRTPLLIRRRVVQEALLWLMKNHPGYAKVKFSQKNLDTYAEDSPPVNVVFRPQKPGSGNVPTENLPVFATTSEGGTEDGECSFAVSGLTGEELDNMTDAEKKLFALKALNASEPCIAYGRSEDPESIFNNPNLYSGMFPWLFPRGTGGFKNPLMQKQLGRRAHTRWLLLYHDRRFATDPYFPFIVFNHDQISAAVRGGWLVTEKRLFDDVVDRILDLDPETLDTLIKRGQEDGYVAAQNEDEKKVCRILPLIEHASAGVDGSITQRKYQRHEIRSMIYEKGLPLFFITFSPVDFKNPICLHYCGRDFSIAPLGPASESYGDRLRAIASNPVACARFFDETVRMFIDIVLRDGRNEDGLFGRTSGYYGTVESQGRLTLHLHLLLWIENSDSPQMIRDKAMEKQEDYMTALVDWLESCHQGEFSTGSEAEIGERLRNLRKEKKPYSPVEIVNKMKEIERQRELKKTEKQDPSPDAEQMGKEPKKIDKRETTSAGSDEGDDKDEVEDDEENPLLNPTLTLPPLVPRFSSDEEERNFWLYVLWITDEVVYRSNRHDRKHRYGCWKNDNCRARYPRDFVAITTFLEENGALLLKKGEAWINTFSVVLSFLLRCNSDVTCLLSGTQAKAVIAYVTDYITKMSLKTHSIFEAVKAVLDKRTDFGTDTVSATESARKALTKIVNILTSRTEVGGPMLCSYLLGNPDHYTNMKFKVFYWYSYFITVARVWNFDLKGDQLKESDEPNDPESDKVILKSDPTYGIAPWSKVNHYIYRPPAFENYSLYDFLRLTDVRKMRPSDEKKLLRNTSRVGKVAKKADVGDCDAEHTEEPQPETTDPPAAPNEADSSNDEVVEEFHEIDDKHCYEFLDGHPNKDTHAVFKLKGDRSYTLNYKGVPLPRKIADPEPDSDLHERYCIIMLTIFFPWRTGQELKMQSESWHHAFDRAELSPRARYVMSNMNLLYECYDASHDFSTLRRKEELKSAIPSSISPDADGCGNGNDVLQGMFGDIGGDITGEALSLAPEDLGDNLIQVLWDMERMKNNMTRFFQAGETPLTYELSQTEQHAVEAVQNVDPMTSTAWRRAVTTAKQCALAERSLALRSSNLSDSSESSDDPKRAGIVRSSTNSRAGKEGNVVVTSIDALSECEREQLQTAGTVIKRSDMELMNQVSDQFSLNVDQKRAYELVVEALLMDNQPARPRTQRLIEDSIDLEQFAALAPPTKDPLRMYLGGIGGTGKSQVVKGILSFLERKKESYKCLVLAPTGSAASLVNGSTYHSALSLGIDLDESATQTRITSVASKFKSVRLIIVDEVSMLSCKDLYTISHQLESAFKRVGTTFGGLHVVLAGDFGQLPPVGWGSLSLYSSNASLSSLACSVKGQKDVLGRALWHTFTTVVILRINMRQRGESKGDSDFRTALGNMRYGNCTEADVELLNSRLLGSPSAPTLSDPRFRNVSVITAWNCDRDAINSVSSERFALESGQKLVRFYSNDNWPKRSGSSKAPGKKKRKGGDSQSVHKTTRLTPAEQRFLWEVPPGKSAHTAGVLELCIGMPVLLKHNEATEICATNGAEGTVVGWDSHSVVAGHNSLKTLFVQLTAPPRDVQVKGLPKNVIPVATSTGSVISMVKDKKNPATISRQQVKVLPNFAMTDYCSQGRTRPFNVVDPRNLKNHQSFYTALSRSSSLEGTLLLFPFNPRKITHGCTGDLRREYRELEILDDISRMRHEGITGIPEGGHRSFLIQWYRETFGLRHVPPHVHSALDWSSGWDGEGGTYENEYSYFELKEAFKGGSSGNDKKGSSKVDEKETSKDPEKGASDLKRGRGDEEDDDDTGSPSKKYKQDGPDAAASAAPAPPPIRVPSSLLLKDPVGLLWDQDNWSCAYDSLLCILFNAFSQHRIRWEAYIRGASPCLDYLTQGFEAVLVGTHSLENVRNGLRDGLYLKNRVHFPRVGAVPTEISRVCEEMFKTYLPITNINSNCSSCPNSRTTIDSESMFWPCPRSTLRYHPTMDASNTSVKIADLIQAAVRWHTGSRSLAVCETCSSPLERSLSMQSEITWNFHPPLWALEIQGDTEHGFDWLSAHDCTEFSLDGGPTYALIGVVYSGGNHFVCRYRDKNGAFWSHDSAEQKRFMQLERDDQLTHVGISRGRMACTWIYMKQ